MLDNPGYSIGIEEGKIKVSKGSLIILKGVKKCGLYMLEDHTSINLTATIINLNNTTMLWLRHLGHLSDK